MKYWPTFFEQNSNTVLLISCDFIIYVFIYLFFLAVRKNTIYKLIWWLYRVRHDTMHYYDVIGYLSSDVTSGAL